MLHLHAAVVLGRSREECAREHPALGQNPANAIGRALHECGKGSFMIDHFPRDLGVRIEVRWGGCGVTHGLENVNASCGVMV